VGIYCHSDRTALLTFATTGQSDLENPRLLMETVKNGVTQRRNRSAAAVVSDGAGHTRQFWPSPLDYCFQWPYKSPNS
jgi:hypothetical protein